MEASKFAAMLSDKNIIDLKKLGFHYHEDLSEFITLLKKNVYKTLSLPDFGGENLVYLDSVTRVRLSAARLLLAPRQEGPFGLKAMEEEIASSLTIENIDFNRDSVRKILNGYAPQDESEARIYGMKKGLDFIRDPANKITEENIHKLYQIAIESYLQEGDRLLPGNYYRHDAVYIVGQEVEHTGLPHQKLPEYMGKLTTFVAEDSEIDDLFKAAVIHFYVAYLHPYFDGNGRMARMIHLWYLVQKGFSSALFIPLSEYVEKSKKRYYNAFTLCERNAAISGVMDVTAFLVYFMEEIYHKMKVSLPVGQKTEVFQVALDEGKVTEKEHALWNFVCSAYGDQEFTTKQLEKDFGDAAYATIRSFVLKFESLGLLKARKLGNKVKYHI